MNITALDIRKQDFGRNFRGFNTEEVLAFLDTLADAFERLAKEKAELEERVKILEADLLHYQELEAILRDTLVTAQKTTEELRENARREAQLILREARIAAEAEMEESRRKALQIRKDIVDLRSHKEAFVARLKALSRSHIEILQAFEREDEELPLTSVDEELLSKDQESGIQEDYAPPSVFPSIEDSDEGKDASKG